MYTSDNSVIIKAREALILSGNKKLIEDEVKPRKDNEVKFINKEQFWKEKLEEGKRR